MVGSSVIHSLLSPLPSVAYAKVAVVAATVGEVDVNFVVENVNVVVHSFVVCKKCRYNVHFRRYCCILLRVFVLFVFVYVFCVFVRTENLQCFPLLFCPFCQQVFVVENCNRSAIVSIQLWLLDC